MAANKQSRGACQFCGKEMTRGGLSRHFKSCKALNADLDKANAKRGKEQTIYHLLVGDAYMKEFWLHLEMKATADLMDLDDYLRSIWLECCGHLSMFSIGKRWQGEELEMDTPAGDLFNVGMQLTHIYDFGTSSETFVKVLGERKGKPLSKNPLFLMARNNMPEAKCIKCKNDAKWICMECIYDHQTSGFLCDDHVEAHPHEEYGSPLPVVNSPRVGMCAYCGPATAPY